MRSRISENIQPEQKRETLAKPYLLLLHVTHTAKHVRHRKMKRTSVHNQYSIDAQKYSIDLAQKKHPARSKKPNEKR